jgi:carboxypeptidase PM20D1
VKKFLIGSAAIVAAAGLVLVANAARLPSRQPPPESPGVSALALNEINETDAVKRLAEGIRHRTVTGETQASSGPEAFTGFQAFLDHAFPLVGKNLPVERLGGHSLLYTWQGRRADLAPLILTAHQDVVPAGDLGAWKHPPFDGIVADGFVWGRGALDDKSGLLALLEAVESLLAKGFTPDRTIFLGFGHNEEGGTADSGAAAIVQALLARGVRGATVVDEGGWIYDKVPGVANRVALIGIAEKGFLSLQLAVSTTGGHSSMPPAESAIGILGRAVDAVEHRPLPARLDGASAALFDTLAPEMSFGMKVLFANRWLTTPLLLRELSKKPASSATVRTTTAATMIHAGDKENVLATTATAVLNFRLLPGDSAESVIEHVKKAVGDPRVAVTPYRSTGVSASRVSSTTSDDFKNLGRAIRSVMPDVLVAPYLTLGATDGRRYEPVAENIYRFLPIDQPGATELLHAPNERIEIGAYIKMIRAYGAIVQMMAVR